MRRWMVALVGLLIALAAIYALVTGVFEGGGAAEAHDEIDSESREELRELLEKADAEDGR